MSLTYTTYQSTLSTLTAIPTTDATFVAALPNVIDYAEGRIYRELDMLVEDVADSSSSTAANVRDFTLPTSLGTFQTVTSVNVVTPAATAPGSGTRVQLVPVARDFLDFCWPSTTGATVPAYFNYFSQGATIGLTQPGLIFGPWPDAAYRVEVIGKIIPTPLSATNTTTFLTTYLPDLFLAASMIFMTGGVMKNFGAAQDNPKEAQSWQSQYEQLLASAAQWEARKRFAGASWTSKPVEPGAQPQRG